MEEEKTQQFMEMVIENEQAEAKESLNDSFNYEELKELLDNHFNRIENLLRYTKEKDINVLNLSKQLQMYRDGIETTLFKSLAMEIIAFRENCRKSLREFSERRLSVSEATKYIEYLKLDLEDTLQNLGIECKGTTLHYNGKDVNANLNNIQINEVSQSAKVELPTLSKIDFNGLVEYVKAFEISLAEILQNNAILDSLVKDCISLTAVYDKGLFQVVLYPVVRSLANTYLKLLQQIGDLQINEENATEDYLHLLTDILGKLDGVLEKCGVVIDEYSSDVYDPKKQRILKMIATDDPELNGRVIKRYSDAYCMGERVIFLAKVDVYKTNK